MRSGPQLWVVPVALALIAAHSVQGGDLEFKRILKYENKEIVLKWEFDEDEHEIQFHLQAGTEGPIYLGFSHQDYELRNMTIYDGFVAGVKDGKGYMDSFEFNFEEDQLKRVPEKEKVVYQLDDSEEDGGVTTLKFKRIVSSCFDESFDRLGQGDNTMVAYKIGSDEDDPEQVDPLDDIIVVDDVADFEFSALTLFSVAATEESVKEMHDDYLSERLTMDGASVSSERHTLCKTFKITRSFDYYKGFAPIINTEDDVNIRFMAAFQCNNKELKDYDLDLDDVSHDMCYDGLGTEYMPYLWSEGEVLPEDYGIETLESDGGDHYILLMVSYDNEADEDDSGMELYVASGDFDPVGKTLVGHHISEKSIVMPSKKWTVQGTCDIECMLRADSSITKHKIVGASLHYGSPAMARMRLLTDTGYTYLVRDEPAIPTHQPSRMFPEDNGFTLYKDEGQIVVDCIYTGKDDDEGFISGGLGRNDEFCIGTVTTSPPLGVSVCDSAPSELLFSTVFGFDFVQDIEDPETEKRRRRKKRHSPRTKRQSQDFSWNFLAREVYEGGDDTEEYVFLDDVLSNYATDFKDDYEGAISANEKLLDGEQVQICRLSGGIVQETVDRVHVDPEIHDADYSPIESDDHCEDIFKGEVPDKKKDDKKDKKKKNGSQMVSAMAGLVVAALLTRLL